MSNELGVTALEGLEAVLVTTPANREIIIICLSGRWHTGRLIYGVGDAYATINCPVHAQHIPAIHPLFRTVVVCAALIKRLHNVRRN